MLSLTGVVLAASLLVGQAENKVEVKANNETARKHMASFEPMIGEWLMNEFPAPKAAPDKGVKKGDPIKRVFVCSRDVLDGALVLEVRLENGKGFRLVIWKELIGWDPTSDTLVGSAFGANYNGEWAAWRTKWTAKDNVWQTDFEGTRGDAKIKGTSVLTLVTENELRLEKTENGKSAERDAELKMRRIIK